MCEKWKVKLRDKTHEVARNLKQENSKVEFANHNKFTTS